MGLCTTGSFRSPLLSQVTVFRLSRPPPTAQRTCRMLDLSLVDSPTPSRPLAAHHLDAHNQPHGGKNHGKQKAREAFDPTERIVSRTHRPSSVASHSCLTRPESSVPGPAASARPVAGVPSGAPSWEAVPGPEGNNIEASRGNDQRMQAYRQREEDQALWEGILGGGTEGKGSMHRGTDFLSGGRLSPC